MSDKDFNARPPSALTAFDLRELSNNESTASCNIRFSFLRMTSGALISKRRFKRLFRIITRRYKSFKSEDAKRPPSSGTNGRNSGGTTGKYWIIIHSGRFSIPEACASRNASTTRKRFKASDFFCCDASVAAVWRNEADKLSNSKRHNKS